MKNFKNKQQGIALLMSLIMLLLITVIGLASVRSSKIDTQTAGNSIYSLMVYQGAESALERLVTTNDLSAIVAAATTKAAVIPGDELVAEQFDNNYFDAETVNGAELTTTANLIYEDFVEGERMYLKSSTQFDYQVFRATATSRLNATGARGTHIQGFAQPVPKS